MGEDTQQKVPAIFEVERQFNSTLARHMERTVGTKKGIGDLILNLETISALVLLAERESEIQASKSEASERYDEKAFFKDLAEIGLEPNQKLKTAVQDMTLKGYIEIDPEGKYSAKKPAVTMSKLLDQAFPGMPGLNLVAYLIQTMDEVLSGRKPLEAAVGQFDQALKIHSVVLKTDEQKPSAPPSKAAAQHQQSAQAKAARLSQLLRARQAKKRATPASQPDGRPVFLSATGEQVEIVDIKEEVVKKEDGPAEIAAGPADEGQIQGQELPAQEPVETEAEGVSEQAPVAEAEVHEESAPMTSGAPGTPADSETVPPSDEPAEGVSPEAEMGASLAEAGTDQAEAAPEAGHPEQEVDAMAEKIEAELSEEEIEAQIAALEQELTLTCPLCTTGKLQKKETGKGKSFYTCSSHGCIFVSWGKPYHLACPWCKNPFLVESTDSAGQTELRCPRATCQYHQRPSWEMDQGMEQPAASPLQAPPQPAARRPRRRVVRRRRVRRKR